MLIFLSIGLVIAQILLTDVNFLALCVNWIFAGCISFGIWYVTKRYHLCGLNEGKAFAISWPILSASMNFSFCYFPRTEQFFMSIVLMLAMILILYLQLNVWQDRQAIGRHILVGLIIGITSTMLPHTLLWLLLLPVFAYHMRCWSSRNAFSTLTGTLLGIWFTYCLLFFADKAIGTADTIFFSADQMLRNYQTLFHPEFSITLIESFGVWQWLFLGLIALLVIIYSIAALLLNAGNSIRAGASISLISTLSIFMVVIFLFDIHHLSFYTSLLSLFFCIQLTIHQANVHTTFNEWWTIFIILAMLTLTALPLWF